MGNCLTRICQSRQIEVAPPTAVDEVVQPAAGPVRAPSPLPTGLVLSAAAQARWRQVCNQPLTNQMGAYGLLKPGTRLDFTYDERAEIGRALELLQPATRFSANVTVACILGDPARFGAVETLIRHGLLDPNHIADGRTMLQTICLYGQNAWPPTMDRMPLKQRITSLVALGARIEQPVLPAIALLKQTWERDGADGRLAAAALIANGCDPLQRDGQQRTLLHSAAQEDNVPVLRGWQTAGLAMHLAVDRWGSTALHVAARRGHHAALRFLVDEGGVDINARNPAGETALHHAALAKHVTAAKTLLELQASPDVEDNDGETPLSIATTYGMEPLCALLVQHGADPHAVHASSRTH